MNFSMRDTVKEQIVMRKLGKPEWIKTGLIFAALIASIFAAYYILGLFGVNIIIFAAVVIGLCVAAYIFGYERFIAWEYEYTLINGELTIDRIMAMKKRKRLTNINLKQIEALGRYYPDTKSKFPKKSFYNCAESEKPAVGFYITNRNSMGDTITVVISPNKDFRTAMKNFIPSKVMIDAHLKPNEF